MALFGKKNEVTPITPTAVMDSFVAPLAAEDESEVVEKTGYGYSPTLDELLTMTPDETFVRVRVPRVTKAARVQYDKFIKLNNKKFLPGNTYLLHPIVAKEVQDAIDRFEAIPTEQMTGKSNMTPELIAELREQAAERTAARA